MPSSTRGHPPGVLNDATVAAVVAFKKDHQLGVAPSANREVVITMISLLENGPAGVAPPPASPSRYPETPVRSDACTTPRKAGSPGDG